MKNLFVKFVVLFSLMLLHSFSHGQSNTQIIRGVVVDKQAQYNLAGAYIVLLNSNPPKGDSSDINGKFKISDVLPGRYDIQVSAKGYKEIILSSIVVTSGKEVILEVGLEESIQTIGTVLITGKRKNETNNELSSVSGRSFSMEEVNRYAGGRSDPSRLAANFAGVSSPDDSRNDIVIRGNSPSGVLWRIEGLNVPNPNHFSTVGTTGGAVSAINTNVLKNSDFFTSAFPSEYGNANAGVFDLNFRNGNSEKREHTLQLGALTGLEAMSEGPINKEKGSSYLFAYRYSFTGLAQAIGMNIGTTATPFYQDFSFKVNSGYGKFGRFTLFGLGAVSKIEFKHDKTDSTDLFADPGSDSYFTSDIGVVGLKHFIKMGKKSYFNTVIGTVYAASNFELDTLSAQKTNPVRVSENKTTRTQYNINTSFNTKINSRLFLKFGAIAEIMQLNLFYRNREFTPTWNQIWDFNDITQLYQVYAHSKYNVNNKLILNIGVHGQFLALNNSKAIEPRIGVKYQFNTKNTLSFGYGLHSQMQPTDVYFYRLLQSDGNYDQSNKNLDFTRSHHLVLGYDILPLKDWRIKSEVYYQMLYNVPVTNNLSSFSMLNAGAGFDINGQGNLTNAGTGTNYGIELTIEKFYSKGYYGLVTGTLYESKYEGSDKIERNTAFNGKYVYNVLVGKEFKFGKGKKNSITVDAKLTKAGGRFYTPVDLAASQMARQQIEKGDEYAFSERNTDFFRLDIKTGVTFNSAKKKISQSLYFDIQNVTNNKNVFALRYNPVSNSINTAYQIGLFPNFVYKIQF